MESNKDALLLDAERSDESKKTKGLKVAAPEQNSTDKDPRLLIREDPFGGKKTQMAFPEKLMCILNNSAFHKVIFWSDEGDAFCVLPDLFTEYVLGPYFQGSKFQSFTRKLNRFSFKRIIGDTRFPSDSIAFEHKLFIRGKPELLVGIKVGSRSTTSQSMSKKRSSLKDSQEPSPNVLGDCQSMPALSFDARISTPETSLIMPQHSASAFDMLQQNYLQRIRMSELLHQVQQNNNNNVSLANLQTANLHALLLQNTAAPDYRQSLPQNGNLLRPILPTNTDLTRLLSQNQGEGATSATQMTNNDSQVLFRDYLQQRFNGRGS